MAKQKYEKQILIEDNRIIAELFGKLDENVKIIEEELSIEIILREGKITLIGDELATKLGERLIEKLIEIIETQKRLNKQELRYTIQLILEGKEEKVKDLLNDVICITASGKSIKPKTLGQKDM